LGSFGFVPLGFDRFCNGCRRVGWRCPCEGMLDPPELVTRSILQGADGRWTERLQTSYHK
jgi:hypothetical protein